MHSAPGETDRPHTQTTALFRGLEKYGLTHPPCIWRVPAAMAPGKQREQRSSVSFPLASARLGETRLPDRRHSSFGCSGYGTGSASTDRHRWSWPFGPPCENGTARFKPALSSISKALPKVVSWTRAAQRKPQIRETDRHPPGNLDPFRAVFLCATEPRRIPPTFTIFLSRQQSEHQVVMLRS